MPGTVDASDATLPMSAEEIQETKALCQALHDASLWIALRGAETILVGPVQEARRHHELLSQVKAHKQTLLAILRETLEREVFGDQDGPAGFLTEVCPTCAQHCPVITEPRRLAMHRTSDGNAVCPGAVQAQEAVVQPLMARFLAERCVQRSGSQLSWMALRGALEGWAIEHNFFLPPRPYLITWMDGHYTRLGDDEAYPRWQGLTFTLKEWFGEDEALPPQQQLPLAVGAGKKSVVLRAH